MDDDFATIELGTFNRTACSPAIESRLEGIHLSAPQSVRIAGPGRFPLCGAYRVSAPVVNRHVSIGHEIVVVAVDAATHEPRSANLMVPDSEPGPMSFDETRPGWELSMAGGWFNFNLFVLLRLPLDTARYHVFATVNRLTSNVCTVEVVKP
jgi:hypothetical protein